MVEVESKPFLSEWIAGTQSFDDDVFIMPGLPDKDMRFLRYYIMYRYESLAKLLACLGAGNY